MKDELVAAGIGGCGCTLAARLWAEFKCRAIGVNTDRSALDQSEFSEKFLLENSAGTAGTPTLGRQAASASYEDLREVLSGSPLVVLLAGLGGATGTGAIPVLARCALDNGQQVVAAVTLPFPFEHASRRTSAEACVSELRELGATVLIHDLADIVRSSDLNGSLTEVLANVEEAILRDVSEEIAHALEASSLLCHLSKSKKQAAETPVIERLECLESENARLKRLLAESMLERDALHAAPPVK